MSGLGWEEPVEPGDGGVGAHEQAVERGENGFSLENFPLAKRYAEGKVEVHVHFAGRRVGRDREATYLCAVVKSTEVVGVVFNAPTPDRVVRTLKSGTYEVQVMVLVGDVQLVDVPKPLIPSWVRLQALDDCLCSAWELPDLRQPVFEGFRFHTDRECGVAGRGVPRLAHESPGNVVEGAPKRMDAVSDDGAPPAHRGLLCDLGPQDVQALLGFSFDKHSVRVAFQKPSVMVAECVQVLLRPHSLEPSVL
jgi:hypothetical protein